MAIYHLQVKVICRGTERRSVVAAAAYRAATALYDAELGRTQNYLAKAGVIHSEVVLPDAAPRRWLDREVLWNEVAAGERLNGDKRQSQLARELEVALPRELSQAEAIALAQDFVREQFVARGMVADLNVHWGQAGDGEAQPHAHIMLTMRRIEAGRAPQGVKVDGREASRERDPIRRQRGRRDVWDDAGAGGVRPGPGHPLRGALDLDDLARHRGLDGGHRAASRPTAVAWPGQGLGQPAGALSEQVGFGLKERAWNNRVLVRVWRERWAEMANARLAELDHDQRIDHRSHAARGLGLEPQNKIGPAGARREQREQNAERADQHRDIARRNGARLLAEPELALQALTQQQSTFTRADMARLVNRLTDGAAQFAAVMTRVEALPELVRVGVDGRGRARFSTRELVEVEQRLVATAVVLTNRTLHGVHGKRRTAVFEGKQLSEEQRLAYLHVTRSRDLVVVVGIAGGGKSTMLGVAQWAWEAQGYRVRGAALSGIAAEGLEGSAGIQSRTIASWEHAWNQGRERLTANDVLVLDEAGMVGSRQLGRLVERVQKAGAKLVLVGDAEQLQAIEAGAAFRAVAERVGVIAITEPRRQLVEWQREATKELATARTGSALCRYEAAGMMQRHATREAAYAGVIARWDTARHVAPTHSQVIFAHERVDVRALNDGARAVRRAAGELGPDQVLQTELGPRAFAEGDRVYFLRNERGLGVKNGTLGTLERIEGERLTVCLDGPGGTGAGRAVTFGLTEYADLDHGYAATVHKNQGTTVDQAHVLATPGMDRHLVYVALSRHRHAVHLHWGEDDFASPARLHAVLGRERAKDTALDYAEPERDPVAAYAERRGLDLLLPASATVAPPGMGQEPLAAVLPAQAGARPTDGAWAGLEERIKQSALLAPGSGRWMVQRLRAEPALRQALPVMIARLRDLGRLMVKQAQVTERMVGGDLAQSIAQAVLAARQEASPAAMQETRTGAAPERGPRSLEPMLPGVPFQPVTAAVAAALIEADTAVHWARDDVTDYLELAYRDPVEAARRLVALERGPGGTAGVAGALARQPAVLGRLRGSGWFFAAEGAAAERLRARKAVGRINSLLVWQREAELLAEMRYRTPVERQRRLETVEVPGLSKRARQAAEALSAAGATSGWKTQLPCASRPPTPDEIARASRVAPVWTAIRANPELHDELTRFMVAASQRLPSRDFRLRNDLSGPEHAVHALSGLLHAAQALHYFHPEFQAYAAGEPERQAEATRLAAEREAAAAREAEEARQKAEKKAKMDAEFAAFVRRLNARAKPSQRCVMR